MSVEKEIEELRNEIRILKEQIQAQDARISQFYDGLHDVSSANIDFIAMETGVDLDMGDTTPTVEEVE